MQLYWYITQHKTIALLVAVALIIGTASTALIITLSRTSPRPQTSAADNTPPAPLLPKSADGGQSEFSQTTAPPIAVITPTPTPSATVSAQRTLAVGEVDTVTAISTDKTTLQIDFITPSFTNISSITYSVSYTADVSSVATTKNIQGSFNPATVVVTGYKTNGYPYIRKTFTLGTCSGSTCVYDSNPRSFSVSASVQLTSM